MFWEYAWYIKKSQMSPEIKDCYQIWTKAVQSSLSRLDRLQKCLHNLVGDEFFSTCSILPADETLLGSKYSVPIYMADVQAIHVPWFHQSRFS